MDIARASKIESKKTLGAVFLIYSTSVVTDANGNVVGEQRYYPFGETRLTTGSIYTDKLFTGQREMVGCAKNILQRFYSLATLT